MPVKATTLVAALGSAARHRGTGSVVSWLNDVERRIWLRDGKVVFAESKDPGEAFAAILAFRGVLQEKERIAISAVAQPGMREDLAIAASGILGPVEVMEHAWVVLEERLSIAFALPGSHWTSEAGNPPDDLPSLNVPLTKVVLEGVRSYEGKDRLAREFPVAAGDIYEFQGPVLAANPEVSLSRSESRLAAVLDGKRTWSDAVGESTLTPSAAHVALYAIAVLGLAVSVTPGLDAPVQDVVPSPEATTSISRVELAGVGKGAEMLARANKEIPELLDVPAEPPLDVVEDAFRALIALYDLGRAHFLGDDDRDAAILLLDRAIESYLVLTVPASRKQYFATPQWDRDVVAASLGGKLSAEKGYVKAGIFLQAGNYLAAEAALLPALQISPREARYHLRQGIAIYLRAKARGAQTPVGATRALQKAIAHDNACDEAYVYLGYIATAVGDHAGARVHYEAALQRNPESREAKRALTRSITNAS